MTRRIGFDDQLRDWVRDVPKAHPNLAVTVLETTRHLPQNRRSRWSMLRTGPAIAGAAMAATFIALVGGFLLLGFVTFDDGPPGTSPSPEPSATASPGVESTPAPRPTVPPSAQVDAFRRTMQASVLEPLGEGVDRIVGDGAGNSYDTWSTPAAGSDPASLRLVVGPTVSKSGDVWVAGYPAAGSIRLGRLGEESTGVLDSAISENDRGLWLRSDGAGGLWVGGANDLNHFDGSSWYWPDTDFNAGMHDVAVLPDGSAIIIWTHDDGPVANRLGRVSRDGWVDLEADVAAAMGAAAGALRFHDVAASNDGRLRILVDSGADGDEGVPGVRMLQLAGTWTMLDTPIGLEGASPVAMTSAPDGSWWTYYEDGAGTLVRELGGASTVVSDTAAGLPAIQPRAVDDAPRERLRVGPDGTVWIQTRSGRLASFDGRAWAARGSGAIDAFDVAPDGTVVMLDHDGGLIRVQPGGDRLDALEARMSSDGAGDGPVDGFLAEEVEPGVHRLLSDGFRDLTYPAGPDDDGPPLADIIVAGRDGSTWRFGAKTYERLGDERTHHWAEDSPAYGEPPATGEARTEDAGHIVEPGAWDDIEVDLEGKAWYALGLPAPWTWDGDWRYGLWHLDETGWRPSGPPETAISVEVPPDGSTWALFMTGEPFDPASFTVRRSLDGQTWETVGAPVVPDPTGPLTVGYGLHVSASGDAWLSTGQLHRLVDGAWATVALPDLGDGGYDLAVSDDGTAWLARSASYDETGGDAIARHDGEGWETWEQGSIPERGNARRWIPPRAGPQGEIWFALKGERECGGLGRFDGEAWQAFLPGRCIYSVDVDADGRAWVRGSAARFNRAGDDMLQVRPVETFVIDPSGAGR